MLKRMVLIFTALATTLPVVAQNDAPLPEGAGKAVVQRMCVGCHQLSVITAKRATKAQWSTLVQQMVSRGADGSDQDIETVVDYLSKSFPAAKDDKAAPSHSPQSLLKQPLAPNASQDTSLLTISPANLEAMLHNWQQSSAHAQSIRMQQKSKHAKNKIS